MEPETDRRGIPKMKMLRIVLASFVAFSGLAVAGSAMAGDTDLIRPATAGPIVREETTLAQLRDWFGPPTARRPVTVACSRVTKVRWGQRLEVYAWRDQGRHVAAVFVRKRSIHSSEHGDLSFHTRRGLRVDDSERRLRRLYPHSRPMTHAGHTHYRLSTGRYDAYLMAKVVDREVVQLEIWPYEFC
jgi:hypothetical protein